MTKSTMENFIFRAASVFQKYTLLLAYFKHIKCYDIIIVVSKY